VMIIAEAMDGRNGRREEATIEVGVRQHTSK